MYTKTSKSSDLTHSLLTENLDNIIYNVNDKIRQEDVTYDRKYLNI